MSYEVDNSAKYFKEHQWVRVEDDGTVLVGISDYAQKALKDIVMFEPPEVGDTVTFGEVFASIESVKAVNDLFAPLSGRVAEKNEELEDQPELANEDPYGTGWMLRIEPSKPDEWDSLLSAEEYGALIEELENE